MKYLGKTFALLALLPLLCGCGATRIVAGQDTQRDSVRVEYRTQYIERIDTAYIEIPQVTDRVITRDTTSVLENDYARSRASILAGGDLYHTLETKPAKRPVPVIAKESVRDSIIYRDREVYREVPVEVVKPLSGFVKVQIWGFWIMFVFAALYIFIKLKF